MIPLHVCGYYWDWTVDGMVKVLVFILYIERLRPRTDTFRQAYWLRIRSNPHRCHYH